MQWTEDMSVGVPMIDNRHRELINKLNSLRAAIKKQVCRYIIDDMLAFLEDYAEIHFCEEEQYMTYHGYPDYALHKEKHDNLVMELDFLKEELRNIRALGLKGSYELSVETLQVVVDWLHEHVMKYDKELGEFLRQHTNVNIDVMTSPCRGEERYTDGSLTVCSICHKICGKKGQWRKKENYKAIPSDIVYSHGICPECLHVYYNLFQTKR